MVCYDIGNVAGAGADRLRQVAQACGDFGTRVQFSVFECRLDEAKWVKLRARLLGIFDDQQDSLRFYLLCDRDERRVEVHGLRKGVDVTGPLVVD